ncbi:Dihydroorotate dehydrogenase family protein [Candidatus Promineifilum breve]|uniref:Dihydroorotate dehydrogenase family protein n=1 Tax=Candidatus Promineifilum breve TaxID=1806508 RepID=A0A160SYJ1_9CHLR|nr:dihydroorotate dehydrogenase-like protein [Candidatus Promineifilum breve]CUS02366.2 Dihydroorotate dehydrogenase family protein [Candidatus Promineifilum breve]
MADLNTSYLDLALKSPLVVSSNPLTYDLDNLRRLEAAGAGAVVLYSLFEEQIELAELGFADYYKSHSDELPEAIRHVAAMKEYNQGAGSYLAHLYQAKHALSIPVIGSLNGYYSSGWTRYARLIEAAGADALELNIYYMPTKLHISGADVEQMYIDLVRDVTQSVRIPVAVKLSPYFSAMANMARRLTGAGASGLVLFNRFYQPDFDVVNRAVVPTLDLSISSELRLRLRWVALLAGEIEADLAITGGVHSAEDVVKSLMAGANVAMMASALIQRGIDHLAVVKSDLNQWLDQNGYASVKEIRGLLSHAQIGDTAALERANYLNVLRTARSKKES